MKKKIDKLRLISGVVIFIMLVVKAISFLRDLILTSTLGATIEADAFNIAYLLSITIFGFISSAYGNSIMPVASELYLKDKKKMQDSINNIVTISCIIAIVLIIICIVYPNIFVRILANNLSEETFILTTRLSRIGIISLILLVFNGTLSILLRIYEKNITPAFAELLFPIPILVGLLMGVSNVNILILLIVIGYFIQVLFQYITLLKCGYKFHLRIDIRDEQLKKMLNLMPPMMVSTGLLQINTILDNQIASSFETGSVTSLLLASKINGLAYTVFATSLMQIIYAKLSKTYAEGEMGKFQIVLKNQVNTILLFIIPASICIIMFNREIVKLLFVRGSFTLEAGNITASILKGYAIGLVFFVLRDVCNYCFYSAKNTKLPSKVSILSIVINIVLNLTLPNFMGIKGTAYATSIAGMISLFILLYFMKKTFNNVKLMSNMTAAKHVISLILMVIIMKILKLRFNNSLVYSIIIMAIGVIVFWGTQIIFTLLLKKIASNKWDENNPTSTIGRND